MHISSDTNYLLYAYNEPQTGNLSWINQVQKGKKNNSGSKTIKAKNHRGMNHIQINADDKIFWIGACCVLQEIKQMDCAG